MKEVLLKKLEYNKLNQRKLILLRQMVDKKKSSNKKLKSGRRDQLELAQIIIVHMLTLIFWIWMQVGIANLDLRQIRHIAIASQN